jgi:hypothetical protein
MVVPRAGAQIEAELRRWPGVASAPHRFGGQEYRLGRREIGHVHGDSLVDIPFPRRVRDAVLAAGMAQAHHVLPESGWVSKFLETEQDVVQAVSLLRQSYELAKEQQMRRDAAGDPAG